MKSFTLISFTLVLSPVFLLNAQAFQCYRCGGHPNRTGYDPDHGRPCPQKFSDDPKYVVKCPSLFKSNGQNACRRYIIRPPFLADYVEYRGCYEFEPFDENSKQFDFHTNCGGLAHSCQCNNASCDCFETLCNGVGLDGLIERGESPYNPYPTSTAKPEYTFSKAQDKSKTEGIKVLWLLFLSFSGQVVFFAI